MKSSRMPLFARLTGRVTEILWRRRYLKYFRLEARLLTSPATEQTMDRVKIEARGYYRAHLREIPDSKGFFTLTLAALVLASYQELRRNGILEDEALESVRRAYSSTYGAQMYGATKIWLAFVSDPVSALRKNSAVPFFKAVFGGWFTFEDERPGENYTLIISQCGFHNFFEKEGAPQLTRVMCSMDRNWLGAIDSSDRPVATRRSLTLATGGNRCEFHFDRAASAPAPTVDVTLNPSLGETP